MKLQHFKSPLVALFSSFVICVSFAQAQSYKLDVDRPEFDDLRSPEIGDSNKTFRSKDWLEAEVKFKVTSSNKDEVFVDAVTVRWYVAVKNPDGKGYLLLKKEVNHVNVPVGEEIYASVYLSPNSVKRLSGSERAGKSILSHVGGEILVNGKSPVDETGYFTSKDKPGWWTAAGLTAYDKIPLLNKSETPFSILWWDRYAEVKPVD